MWLPVRFRSWKLTLLVLVDFLSCCYDHVMDFILFILLLGGWVRISTMLYPSKYIFPYLYMSDNFIWAVSVLGQCFQWSRIKRKKMSRSNPNSTLLTVQDSLADYEFINV